MIISFAAGFKSRKDLKPENLSPAASMLPSFDLGHGVCFLSVGSTIAFQVLTIAVSLLHVNSFDDKFSAAEPEMNSRSRSCHHYVCRGAVGDVRDGVHKFARAPILGPVTRRHVHAQQQSTCNFI